MVGGGVERHFSVPLLSSNADSLGVISFDSKNFKGATQVHFNFHFGEPSENGRNSQQKFSIVKYY